jgi:hypothetical protein
MQLNSCTTDAVACRCRVSTHTHTHSINIVASPSPSHTQTISKRKKKEDPFFRFVRSSEIRASRHQIANQSCAFFCTHFCFVLRWT